MSDANIMRITRALCDESWEGRWSPFGETNIRPLAEHTATVLDAAGCALLPRNIAPLTQREHGELVMDLVVALESGDYIGADDSDFIENLARSLWGLGWRHPSEPAPAEIEAMPEMMSPVRPGTFG